MANAVDLAVRMTGDASDAAASFDAVADSAKRMGSAVDSAAKQADSAAGKLERVGEGADNLDDKAGRATGSLGALSSGFELVGAEKYATGLQSAAMATDFLSGAGQALILITESERLANLRTTASTIAKTAAEKAAAAGSKALAAAQWLVNAAMTANPVGLLVVGLLALAAIVYLAYQRSATFRAVLAKLGAVASAAGAIIAGAFDTAKDAAVGAFGWIRSHWPLLLAIITGPIGLAVLVITRNWDRIRAGAAAVIDRVKRAFSWSPVPTLQRAWSGVEKILTAPFTGAERAIRGIADGLSGVFSGALDGLTSMIDDAIDAVNRLIRAFNRLPGPDLPTISGFSTPASPTARGYSLPNTAARVAGARGRVAMPAAGTVVNITFPGLVTDPYATANAIRRVLSRRDLIVGGNPT